MKSDADVEVSAAMAMPVARALLVGAIATEMPPFVAVTLDLRVGVMMIGSVGVLDGNGVKVGCDVKVGYGV